MRSMTEEKGILRRNPWLVLVKKHYVRITDKLIFRARGDRATGLGATREYRFVIFRGGSICGPHLWLLLPSKIQY